MRLLRDPRTWACVVASGATTVGLYLAYWRPNAPLLAYWLAVGLATGLVFSGVPTSAGVQRRLEALGVLFGILIIAGLFTTQVAARRTISATHLVYRGVHLVGVDSFHIGAGDVETDIRLQTISAAQMPWSLRVRRLDDGSWELVPITGIEQLRVRHGSTRPIADEYDVARSAVISPGEFVAIVGPDESIVDTLRLTANAFETAAGSVLRLEPENPAIEHRYERQLARGTALSNLAGPRSGRSNVYERFVRVQRIPDRARVNGASVPLLDRWRRGDSRYLVSAMPPYSLEGPTVAAGEIAVADSAFIEVRASDVVWQFAFLADWRRQPGAERGVAIIFHRNPRPMDTPLPLGVSCQDPGAACGAISLRRLPPPVAHIALDQAGFDPARFGLLGTLRVVEEGYEVVLPGETYHVHLGLPRPVAVPVVPLDAAGDREGEESRPAPTGSFSPLRATWTTRCVRWQSVLGFSF